MTSETSLPNALSWRGRQYAAAVGCRVVVAATVGGERVLRGGLLDVVFGFPPLDLTPASVQSTLVVDRQGSLLRPFVTDDGRWRLDLDPADVDPLYLKLLYAYEDQRFLTHHGVDWLSMARALGQLGGHRRVVSGGSTLTMQVARLLEPRDERTVAAKIRQVARAFELERTLTKTQILALYLKLAPSGGNIEGIRAASYAYFGKEPRRLSHAEAALLVALPQSPEFRRPDRNARAAALARDRVLDRALAKGAITAEEARLGKLEPVPQARRPFPMLAPHLAEELVAAEPGRRLHRTTIDVRLQQSLEVLARTRMEALGAKLNTAIVAVDNLTGEIVAQVGGAGYFERERAGAVDLARAYRSPGSALKPFIYGLAFENGIAHPETLLDDRPSRFGSWAPENFDDSFHGSVTARKALQMSLNLPAVQLLEALGAPKLVARLKSAGANIVLPKDSTVGLAVGLGGLGIRPLDLAALYAGIARGGETVPLVTRLDGAADEGVRPGPRRLMDPVSAWYVFDVLKGVVPPTNALAGQIAFKTGTSYGYRDAWAAGFDRRHTVVVWVGRPDGVPVPGLVGRVTAAPILFDAFARIGGAIEDIPRPRGTIMAMTTASLPPPLRHIRKDIPKTVAATSLPQLAISFPPDGARVDLGLGKLGSDEAGPLALKALGGVGRLTWLVNGVPLDEARGGRTAFWQPDGAGFAQVSVMDATGRIATSRVRID